MSCPEEIQAGSYVFGALSSTERHEFEQHLTTCAECRRMVQELAGMPGLLAKVPAEVWESESPEGDVSSPPLPDTLLPRLLREARRERGRRTTFVAAIAAAAAVIVVAGGFLAADRIDHHDAGSSNVVTAGQAMTAVGGETAMSARLVLNPVGWGTKVRLVCKYAAEDPAWAGSDGSGGSKDSVYTLVVTDRAGHAQQVASWKPLPGTTMTVLGSTATTSKDIASVEVRAASGATVLRLRS